MAASSVADKGRKWVKEKLKVIKLFVVGLQMINEDTWNGLLCNADVAQAWRFWEVKLHWTETVQHHNRLVVITKRNIHSKIDLNEGMSGLMQFKSNCSQFHCSSLAKVDHRIINSANKCSSARNNRWLDLCYSWHSGSFVFAKVVHGCSWWCHQVS